MKNRSIFGLLVMFTVLTGLGFASTQDAFAGAGPDVTLTKTVNKDGSQTGVDNLQVVAGTQVTYNYLIQNTGDVILVCTTLTDDQSQNNPIRTYNQNVSPGGFLALHQEPVTINADVTNTGTINCFFEGAQGLTLIQDTDTATVDVVDPSVTIDKTVNKDGSETGVDNLEVIQGTGVTYVYVINNNGDVPLTNCHIDDDVLGNNRVSGEGLAVSQTKTFTDGPHTINSDTPNEATVTCDDVAMFTPTDSDTANVDVIDPMLTISKSVFKTGSQTVNDAVTALDVVSGTDVTYVYDYENTGDVDLENCQITDSVLGIVTGVFNLAQGSGAAQATDGPNTIGSTVTNDAEISCDQEAMNDVDATSNEVTVTVVDPMLTIEKRADGQLAPENNPLFVNLNQQVTYSFHVENTGDVELMNCQINDPMLGGDLGASFNLGVAGDHDHDEENVVITQDIWNTATVECNDVAMSMVDAVSNTVHVELDLPSCVDIVKTVDPERIVSEGETVTYTYDVTNCGETDLSQCNVVDDSGTPGTQSPATDDDVDIDALMGGEFALTPGNSKTFNNDVFIDEFTKNTATVTCIDPEENMVGDTDMATVSVIMVGGEFLPINSVSLVLGGIQSSAVWILPTIAGLAATGFYLVKYRNREE